MGVPLSLFSLVILAVLATSLSFHINLISRFATGKVLSMSEAASSAPEFVGAKKFSMKDRYTNTVFTSEQISKILPHRYPFLLVDKVILTDF